jgi:hypothetical protein
MNDISVRAVARIALLLTLPVTVRSQTAQPGGTLAIAGQTDHATLVKINGKAYVDIESLARITHGTIQFQGNQTILTIPGGAGSSAPPASTSTAAVKTPQLSGGFLAAAIEALTEIREWRSALVNAVQNNYPVTDNWIGALRRSAEAKLQLAMAATMTEPDQKAAELLRSEFANMQQMSDLFLGEHAKVNYIDPSSFDNNSLDQKILACARSLGTMAATKEFQDEMSCH